MRILEIRMRLSPANLLERFAGLSFAYETTITDGAFEVVGRGPTPEASREAALVRWELAEISYNTAVMYP
jgi:hypothetical protein